MLYYKNAEFATRTITNENVKIAMSKNIISQSKSIINDIGMKLYKQFSSFVLKNKDLYDADFVELFHTKFKEEIESAEFIEEKKAIRLSVKFRHCGTRFIMIPILFLNNVDEYEKSRRLVMKFGKDANEENVKKHYDEKILRLEREIEMLEGEKCSFIGNDHDYDYDFWE